MRLQKMGKHYAAAVPGGENLIVTGRGFTVEIKFDPSVEPNVVIISAPGGHRQAVRSPAKLADMEIANMVQLTLPQHLLKENISLLVDANFFKNYRRAKNVFIEARRLKSSVTEADLKEEKIKFRASFVPLTWRMIDGLQHSGAEAVFDVDYDGTLLTWTGKVLQTSNVQTLFSGLTEADVITSAHDGKVIKLAAR
jgi:hypothetical protein